MSQYNGACRRCNKEKLYAEVYGEITGFDPMEIKTIVALPSIYNGYDINILLDRSGISNDANYVFIENGKIPELAYEENWKNKCRGIWDDKYQKLSNKKYFFGNLEDFTFYEFKKMCIEKADLMMLDVCGTLTKGMQNWIYDELFRICNDNARVFFTFSLQGILRNENCFHNMDDVLPLKDGAWWRIQASYGFKDNKIAENEKYVKATCKILNYLTNNTGRGFKINNGYIYCEENQNNPMLLVDTTIK